jgi:S1-C subfamily serine protease
MGQGMRPAVARNLPFAPQPNNPVQPNVQVPPRFQNLINGAAVTNIEPNSPAEKAGLQVGDVITAVDNTKIDANHSLSDLIQTHKPGDQVALAVTRGSQSLTLNIELGAAPQSNTSAYLGIRFAPSFPDGGNRPRFQGPRSN